MHCKLPNDARLAQQCQVVQHGPGCPCSHDGERCCRASTSNPGFGLDPRTALAARTDFPPALDAAIHVACWFANSTASPTRTLHLRALNRRQQPADRIGQRQHQPTAVAPLPAARRPCRRIPGATVVWRTDGLPEPAGSMKRGLDESCTVRPWSCGASKPCERGLPSGQFTTAGLRRRDVIASVRPTARDST